MQIIDGKKLADEILKDIKAKVEKLESKPTLAVILANNNPASNVYVNKKEKVSKGLGFNSMVYRFDESVTQSEIIDLIKKLNEDKKVNAILVQLPLFPQLNEYEIIEAIDPKKDVDGFHPINAGKLTIGLKPYIVPCTPKGVLKLLKNHFNDNLEGREAVIIGRSNIVGKPLISLLLKENMTVTVAHSKTKNLKDVLKTKDIIISATGAKNLVKKDMVKKGAAIIDVGISKNENNKLVGDVDFNDIKDLDCAITPVPGGVGPMTIAMLMENTLELYFNQKA